MGACTHASRDRDIEMAQNRAVAQVTPSLSMAQNNNNVGIYNDCIPERFRQRFAVGLFVFCFVLGLNVFGSLQLLLRHNVFERIHDIVITLERFWKPNIFIMLECFWKPNIVLYVRMLLVEYFCYYARMLLVTYLLTTQRRYPL